MFVFVSLLPSGFSASLVGLKWIRFSDYLRFRIRVDQPIQYKINDYLETRGYLYLDLLNLEKPYESRTLRVNDPCLSHVEVLSYPGSQLLRMIFYPPPGNAYRVSTSEEGRCLNFDFLPAPSYREQQKIVIIDPGHGGQSRGARSATTYKGRYIWEKDINLQIALKLKKLIDLSPNTVAYLTRSQDQYVSLNERVNFGSRMSGDLFISIHCNAVRGFRRTSARGVEFYYWHPKGSVDEASKYLEELENDRSLELSGSAKSEELKSIIRNLLTDKLEEQKAQSISLCSYLNNAFGRLTYFRKYNRGIKSARFKVLANYKMPAALIEVGFISNPRELRYLVDEHFQTNVAKAIFNAINLYFYEAEPLFRPYKYALN